MPLVMLGIATVAVIIARLTIIDIMYVPTPSMEPTLPVGSRLLYLRPHFQSFLVLLGQGWRPWILAVIAAVTFALCAVLGRRQIIGVEWGSYVVGRRWSNVALAGVVGAGLVGFVGVLPGQSGVDWERVQRGDVVIVEDANFWLGEGRLSFLVKRVVAVGGDSVSGDGEVLRVNGVVVDEPYLPVLASRGSVVFDRVVPEGHIFLMGDNREDSADSRFFDGSKAFPPQEAILAEPILVVPEAYLPAFAIGR